METFTIGPSTTGPSTDDPPAHDHEGLKPFLEVDGIEGSSLRATPSALTVCSAGGAWSGRRKIRRSWRYDQLGSLRLDAYGSVGVIRATIRASGTDLPLLLLEPDQITAARRALEVVRNLMSNVNQVRQDA
jgi:hypothetical protein